MTRPTDPDPGLDMDGIRARLDREESSPGAVGRAELVRDLRAVLDAHHAPLAPRSEQVWGARGGAITLPTEAAPDRADKIESAAGYVVAVTDGTHDTMTSHDHSKCLPWAMDMLRAALAWSGER